MTFHLPALRTGARTWLEWIADAFLWVGVLWFAIACLLIVPVVIDTDERWGVWFGTALPLLIPSAVAAALGYVVNRLAKRH